MTKGKATLGVFGLAMMNVAAVFSLRGLPMVAQEGWTLFFYILFATVLFLIPVSLVAAELATGWPKSGGVFRWVKEAFGVRTGFVAVWLQWIQNVIWYPTQLAFVTGCLSYLFLSPALASNRWFTVGVVLVVYWAATLLNFRGVGAATKVASLGVIVGTIVPGVIIIGLGVYWLVSGQPIEINQGPRNFLPDLSNFGNISYLAGIVLLFAGMEVGAVHVREMGNPRKEFPRALLMAAAIIILVLVFGALAVAFAVPGNKISLDAGVMQSFQHMLGELGLNWLPPILGGLVAFGAVASVIAWLAGPSKGLLATREFGAIPPFMQKTNRHGVQTRILLIQGCIVTVLGLLYGVMPSVSGAFFMLTALASMLYMLMYILMYAAAIRLRISQPDVPRAYKVPGGLPGMVALAGVGMLAVIFAIIVAWFPPAGLAVGTPLAYVLFLAGGVVLLGGAPLVVYALRKPSWVATVDDD